MRFACDNCGAQYMIADEKIGDRGVKVKCKKCSHMIIVRPPSQQQEEAEATQSLADTPDAPTPEGQMGSAFDTMFGNQQPAAAAAGGGAFDTQATSQYQAPLGGVGMEAAAGAAAGAGAGVAAEGGFSSGYGDDFGDSGSNGHGANGDAPGAASFDSGSGGAFGFEGGASSSGETDFALGSLERQAEEEANEPAASSRPAGEKEWYVAIEDSQVGPIDIGEVEERWDGRELDEDSLAWKAGMADWMPIVEVPELAYLVTERPQNSVPSAGASFGNTASTLGGGIAAASSSVSSASFEAEGPAIDWKPSAASALSSLVEEEVAPAPSVPDTAPAPQPALDGMPSFGAGEVFGSGSNGAEMSLGAPGPVAPMGDAGGGWSVPESRRSGGSSPVLLIMVGGMFIMFLAVVGFGAWYFMTQPPPGPAPTQPTEPTTPPTQVAGKGETNEKPETAENPADAQTAEPAPEKPTDAKADEAKKPEGKGKGKDKDGKSSKPKGRDKPRSNKPKSGKDSMDEVFDKPKPKAAAATAELDRPSIVAGVKANNGKLSPCLTAARSKGEILPGKYKFILNWRILPNGGVSGGSLTGPREVMGTSLPACFSRVMSSWKFKPSKSGAPIKNFPLSANVR